MHMYEEMYLSLSFSISCLFENVIMAPAFRINSNGILIKCLILRDTGGILYLIRKIVEVNFFCHFALHLLPILFWKCSFRLYFGHFCLLFLFCIEFTYSRVLNYKCITPNEFVFNKDKFQVGSKVLSCG